MSTLFYPHKIILELSSICNMACLPCFREKRCESRNKSLFISFNAFSSIISRITQKPQKAPILILAWDGESLLNPDFNKIFELACKLYVEGKISLICFNTNAVCLNKSLSLKLIESMEKYKPAVEIVFSIDAASSFIFRKIKRAYGFEKVIKNVLYFIKLKFQKKIKNLKLRLQYLVLSENFSQAEDFYKSFKHYFTKNNWGFNLKFDYNEINPEHIDIFFHKAYGVNKEAEICYNTLKKILKEKNVISFESSSRNCNPSPYLYCQEPFRTMVISTTGEITLCCRDTNFSMCSGNIFKYDNYITAFNNEKANKIRQNIATGILPEICKQCDVRGES